MRLVQKYISKCKDTEKDELNFFEYLSSKFDEITGI